MTKNETLERTTLCVPETYHLWPALTLILGTTLAIFGSDVTEKTRCFSHYTSKMAAAASLKKNEKSQYLSNGLTDFDEIS